MVSPAASQAVHRGSIPLDRRGELFELVMEPVLKTGGCKSLGGSNPSLSAIFNTESSLISTSSQIECTRKPIALAVGGIVHSIHL